GARCQKIDRTQWCRLQPTCRWQPPYWHDHRDLVRQFQRLECKRFDLIERRIAHDSARMRQHYWIAQEVRLLKCQPRHPGGCATSDQIQAENGVTCGLSAGENTAPAAGGINNGAGETHHLEQLVRDPGRLDVMVRRRTVEDVCPTCFGGHPAAPV